MSSGSPPSTYVVHGRNIGQAYMRCSAAYSDALSTDLSYNLSQVVLSSQRRLLCKTRVYDENGDRFIDSLSLSDGKGNLCSQNLAASLRKICFQTIGGNLERSIITTGTFTSVCVNLG